MSGLPVLTENYATRPVRPAEPEQHQGWTLKVYEITYTDDPLSPELNLAARQAARERLPLPAVTDTRYGVGFLGIHEGRGGNFVFLDWWAQENELHHHVWFSDSAAAETLRPAAPTDPIACCWDLSVIAHEREAWIRHVLARPAGPSLAGYLADVLDARV